MSKLKVGDRVAVYTHDYHGDMSKSEMRDRVLGRRATGKLNSVSADGECGYVIFDCGSTMGWASLKQCRRLKPRAKPREFWINEAMIPHLADDVATSDLSAMYNRTFIHVREVRKKQETNA